MSNELWKKTQDNVIGIGILGQPCIFLATAEERREGVIERALQTDERGEVPLGVHSRPTVHTCGGTDGRASDIGSSHVFQP